MTNRFGGQIQVASSHIGFDVFFQTWPIEFPANQLLSLVNSEMSYKQIIVVTIYDLIVNDILDVWEALVVEHFLDVFLVLQKAYSFECFNVFVIILQLKELQSHNSDVCIRILKSYFVLEKVLELVQLEKNSYFVYEHLVERRKLTWLACQKTRYSGQQGLQTVQDLDIFGVEGFFFLCTLLRVSR